MTAPKQPGVGAVELDYPFTGEWLVRNSPANRVPSHGTELFGSAHAIDFVPVDRRGRTAAFSIGAVVRSEDPARFPGFGRPVLAPIAGKVVAVGDGEPDHHAYRGFPSIAYALTQRSRAALGWSHLAGNHILIDAGDALVALCHLRLNSIQVQPGDTVRSGDRLARCGNSGNSTEPHLHLQAVDDRDIATANAVPIRFHHGLPRNGQIVAV